MARRTSPKQTPEQRETNLREALARMLDRMDGKGEDAEQAAEYIACDYPGMTIAELVAYVRGEA